MARTFLFIFFAARLLFGTEAFAQSSAASSAPVANLNWYNKDFGTDHSFGVSTEKAYNELLKKRKGVSVIVAIIDSGTDTTHEDLRANIWKNAREIAGNGKDDDGNGFVDDVHGWNFIGGKDGKNIGKDTYEVTRLLAKMEPQFQGKSRNSLSVADQAQYDLFLKVKQEYNKQKSQSAEELKRYTPILNVISFSNDLVKKTYHVNKVDSALIQSTTSTDPSVRQALNVAGQLLHLGYKNLDSAVSDLKEGIKHAQDKLDFGLDTAFHPRAIVGDHYADPQERIYGNNDVTGPDALHGTHVSGIIGALRNNGKGINGIAAHVILMPIRAVPDGDERDKDIASAIRYAVDNGAKIVNMSFGKGYSPQKQVVDEAVRYAAEKGVLLIHAAGNESANKDSIANYPNRYLLNGDTARNWIEVGATARDTSPKMVADFSNYGQHTVDVFAPGVDIYSTVPKTNHYKNESGTSMACPVVVGVAAVLESYFPQLTAVQVKEIILKSAVPYRGLVQRPGSKELVPFSSLSRTGGVVNLYQAVKRAMTYPVPPRSK